MSFTYAIYSGLWIRSDSINRIESKLADDFFQKNSWSIVKRYHVDIPLGYSVIGHPQFALLLEDISARTINNLIIQNLTHLVNSWRELAELTNFFYKNEANIIILDQQIDTSQNSYKNWFQTILAINDWQEEIVALRTQAIIQKRKSLGKPFGGPAPFGYCWNKGELTIDIREAAIRRKIYTLFLELRRKQAVARTLNNEGYRMRSGGKFTATTIDRILRDPIAIGAISRGNIPPLIQGEIWESCQVILKQQDDGNVGKSASHLFSGLLFCKQCNKKMYVPTKAKKYVCSGCKNKIPIDDLESVFHEQIREKRPEVYNEWYGISFMEQRAIIEALVKKVETDSTSIHFEFYC